MNLTKRILSLVLTLALLMGNFPMAAFATEEEIPVPTEVVEEETVAPTEVVTDETTAATEATETETETTEPETEASQPAEEILSPEQPAVSAEAAMAAKSELEATIEKQIRAFAKSIDGEILDMDTDYTKEISFIATENGRYDVYMEVTDSVGNGELYAYSVEVVNKDEMGSGDECFSPG